MPTNRLENAPVPRGEGAYWESIVGGASAVLDIPLWRAFCDDLHERLIRRWLGGERFEAALKTDLFDEAVGQGLVGVLGALADEVYGVDIAGDIVREAARKHPGLRASVGDVRRLDFAAGTFDVVLSDSTLDHFVREEEIREALGELARVLKPGGRLLITLDNPVNPVVALRNRMPQKQMGELGLVPYFMGRTLSMGGLVGAVADAGLEVLEKRHIMHVPRVVALQLCRMVSGWGRVHQPLVRAMMACEAAAALPTARFTGHFCAVLARKLEGSPR